MSTLTRIVSLLIPPTGSWLRGKLLKVADELVIYRDERRTEKLVTVRESSQGWLTAITGYEAFDREEELLGS